MKLSTTEKAVVIGVSLVGMGVAASAALIEYFDIPTTTPESTETKEKVFEIRVPASKEELIKTCADGYLVVKQPLSKVIRIVGQMLVAPIALKVLDAAYNAYSEKSNSSSNKAGELMAEQQLKNDLLKAIARPE
ncbi:hypothetical protein BWQ96_02520 [Gracilariopsis chorda]|uniref:Uncharacterized protein n=1 Tax=Gracilariopsis chorda TaxID=448386 RepID=A0A2V3IZT9_9FLOR|nr:hypothetical protein BWQ96_02520 [Gracilariopsis chorda]|eukprot:PXF47658.1 hypothetical protein BWQ96_02520 [Gracilariopsis chorda]